MKDEFIRGSEWRKWDLHLHTQSSYDYQYQGEDADRLLCEALKKNSIAAVAITDHFVIDAERINKMRELAPEIVFFPGVELRADKGATNLHIILIFDCNIDLRILSDDFQAIMIRTKAKHSTDKEKIYWKFEDVIEFAKNHKAIISVHAGNKSNGVDDKILNVLPIGQAIKEDIAKEIDFFEMGKISDINDYREHVFDTIQEKPMIICSDNHNPRNYVLKENLWIKSDLTFDGLLQCIYQPRERVFVGTVPDKIEHINQKASNYIDKIAIKRIEKPRNVSQNWFDADLELNPGLVSIIGNKGSGKSALSDIIALGCNSKNMKEASFLNSERFMKQPKNLAADYNLEIIWKDEHKEEKAKLDDLSNNDCTIENAQYLPQKFIENVCNDLDNQFQEEINKVIFSYIDNVEKGNAKDLNQLIEEKTINIKSKINELNAQLSEINEKIIKDERLMTTFYKNELESNLKKRKEDLQRIERSKPKEVQKPDRTQSKEYIESLEKLNQQIVEFNKEITETETRIIKLNEQISIIDNLEYNINELKSKVQETNEILKHAKNQLDLKEELLVKIESPEKDLVFLKTKINSEISKLKDCLNEEKKDSLVCREFLVRKEKEKLISEADTDEKEYQKYLQDIENWKKCKNEIIGDKDKENTIKALEEELNYINNQLLNDYESHKKNRCECIENIFNKKKEIANIYEKIYKPIEIEMEKVLKSVDSQINFSTNMVILDSNFKEKLLSYISKNYSGKFSGKIDSINTMDKILKSKNFNDLKDVIQFVNEILECVYEDIDNSSSKIRDKKGFYDFVGGLEYIDIAYSLKVGELSLQELSPGERGIVLLFFYLALSKDEIPIIIDQPEDNLDNQSVYDKLVPCICESKKRRQVIIVTHNPNIAIACDAEQIIYCDIDKYNHKISYTSGSIENERIKQKVIDVLEGTMPAFDLRRKKYMD